jgi:catechol 2,3-dioxygenase-like lactoylglutathione lyase family enzyme
MTSVDTAHSPPLYRGPFNNAPSLGIDRAHYIALQSTDPAAAAKFAVEHMGFDLVHVDRDKRHYLRAHGLDAYSLVYGPGEQGAVDHISYALMDADDLLAADAVLAEAGIKTERIEQSPLWRHGPALRFKNPSGQTIELTPAVNVPPTMAAFVAEPKTVPAPITFDHCIVRATDVAKGFEFASKVMGLKESGRIVAPDGVPILGFFRCHTLYHCYGLARSRYDGLHHLQFTLKTPWAVYAAHEKMKAGGKVEIIWGPLRHGAGHNVVFYFRDHTGHIVEYSAEEEIILNDANYVPLAWPITDPKAADEWHHSHPPESFM